MKSYGYSVTFSNGASNSGMHVKAESERELIKSIIDSTYDRDRTILSITVTEMKN